MAQSTADNATPISGARVGDIALPQIIHLRLCRRWMIATILAGQTQGIFDITIVDDAESDGPKQVTITATAAGMGGSFSTWPIITVSDGMWGSPFSRTSSFPMTSTSTPCTLP